MIRCMMVDADLKTKLGGVELIDEYLAGDNTKIWVDLYECKEADEMAIYEQFNCHELAITDVMRLRHPPKIERFSDQLFILFKLFTNTDENTRFENIQCGMFIGHNFLISRHSEKSQVIDDLFACSKNAVLLGEDPLQLAIKIFHESNGMYLTELFKFEYQLELVEEEWQVNPNDTMMKEITTFRSSLIKLTRIFQYHVNVGQSLHEMLDDSEVDMVQETDRHIIIDLNDRLTRLFSLTQMYYAICGDLINGYLSVASHQLNNTMKVLTLITAIFVPLGFLAGIYGMNFKYIPELENENGYFILIGVMITIATVLLGLFKRKKWL